MPLALSAQRQCAGPCSTSYSAVGSGGWTCRRARPVRLHALAASPYDIFDAMDRQAAAMDREFEAMTRQMDRDMESAFSRARAMERQVDSDVQRAVRDATSSIDVRTAPNVDIQRQEERGIGSYRYYERIQITNMGPGSGSSAYRAVAPNATAATIVVARPPASSPFNTGLVAAMMVVGGYVALTAAFNSNYQLTNYAESKRWLLLALWPLLFLFSPTFREQFSAAVRGQKAARKAAEKGGSGDGGM